MSDYVLAWCHRCNDFKPAIARVLAYGEKRFECQDCKKGKK